LTTIIRLARSSSRRATRINASSPGRPAIETVHNVKSTISGGPDIRGSLFITDGPVWTSAGMTAGIDLALAMVEGDLGADVARAVAKHLVYHRRAGGQSQFSRLLDLEPKSARIQNALAYAKRNLHTPLTVAQLAEAALSVHAGSAVRFAPRQANHRLRRSGSCASRPPA
jgi:hypothetical protein